ncbi:DUF58 domain-containing protein [Jatrophihabitans sp. YIM 134969]
MTPTDPRSADPRSADTRSAAVARRRLDVGGLWRSTTARARALLVVGVVLVLAGLVLRMTDLTRAGLFVVALPLAAAAVVTRARLRVACARHSDPPLAVAGSAVEVVLTLTNRSLVPTGALHLEDQMPRHLDGQARFTLAGLASQESRAVVYRLADVRRGRYVTGPLRIRIDDPFGLVEVVRSFTGRSEVLVTPKVEALSAPGPAVAWDVGDNAGSRSVGALGAEDASIREYRHGDDLRKIHWRSTARTGSPMVRQDERPWQGRVTVVADTRRAAHATAPEPADGPAVDLRDRDSLEWAVSAVASIADRMLASSRDTGLLYEQGTGDALPVRAGVGSTREVAERLAELTPSARSGFDRLVAAAQAAARESVIVAVLGELDRESLDALLAVSRAGRRSAGTLIAVLLDVEGWRSGTGPGDPASRRTEDAAARLAAEGWTVAVAHRGESVSEVWDRMLRAGGAGRFDVDAVRTVRW